MSTERHGPIWERDGDAYYGRVEYIDPASIYYMIVEPLADGSWDWQVWRSAPNRSAVHGVVSTLHQAMRAAERAV